MVIEFSASPHGTLRDAKYEVLPYTDRGGNKLVALLVRVADDSTLKPYKSLEYALEVVQRYANHKISLWGSLPMSKNKGGEPEFNSHIRVTENTRITHFRFPNIGRCSP